MSHFASPPHRRPSPALVRLARVGQAIVAADSEPQRQQRDGRARLDVVQHALQFLEEQEAPALPAKKGFPHRGIALVHHMNKCRKHKIGLRIAPHVRQKVEVANNCFAVSERDVIDVDEKRPKRIKGKGQWQCYLPRTLCRIAWGAPWGPPSRRRTRQGLEGVGQG